MLKSAQKCKEPHGRHPYTEKARADPLRSRPQVPLCSQHLTSPPHLPPLSSRLVLPVPQRPTDPYNFLRLQPCGRPWLLHGSPPPVPAWLEKQSEKDLGSWQKSAEDRERGATPLENGPRSLSSMMTHPL